MTEQDKFRFQLGDEESEPPAIDEALQRRVHKLSQRMSFLTLMLPCLIALVIYVAYRDISLRVAQTQYSELQSVDRLAADLKLKTDAMLARVTELETAVGAKLDEVSKSVPALQEGPPTRRTRSNSRIRRPASMPRWPSCPGTCMVSRGSCRA